MIVLRCPRCNQPLDGRAYTRPTDDGHAHTRCPHRTCLDCRTTPAGPSGLCRRCVAALIAHAEIAYLGDWTTRRGVRRPTRPTRRTETAA